MAEHPKAADLHSDNVTELFKELGSSPDGLSTSQADAKLALVPKSAHSAESPWKSFLNQFLNPIQLLLIIAAILSGALGEVVDCLVIVFILLASAVLSFVQEFRAGNAVAELIKLVATKSTVIRGGTQIGVPLNHVVPGDVVLLSAGTVIPGDGLVFEEDSLFVDQASLTGESFPVEKSILPGENGVFAGTNVISGTAKMLVHSTGKQTQLGGIATALASKRPLGDFQNGIHQLGRALIQLTIFLTLLVLMINLIAHRPLLDSFMFSLALAVGLTPQLLPAIISINLSRGALAMTKDSVIVKRLVSIENFGSMTILCSDKTGTLTQGTVVVAKAIDPYGNEASLPLEFCQLNAIFESGYANPIDLALRTCATSTLSDGIAKLGELPYDFQRKRLSVLLHRNDQKILLTKGAVNSVMSCCTLATSDSGPVSIEMARAKIAADFEQYSNEGYRVLGIASRFVTDDLALSQEHEKGMTFEGLLLLHDPLREESADTIKRLAAIGIELKMITGDNRHVASYLGKNLGLNLGVLLGSEMDSLTDEALKVRAKSSSIFAEIEPRQKQRIILALKKSGAVVGYIGDGVNDGPALRASDVSISVSNAVDVAKEAADFVMLKPDLSILIGAVIEGRRTFTNTMKYIFMATSANFGNMFSLAGASLLMPFLPLLAKQVLLTNLLTDLPEMTIAGDNVDEEVLQTTQKWNLAFLQRFMLVFGLLSSVFDFATFGVLIWIRAEPTIFRTAWFTESVLSASLIVFVFRSRRWIGQSKPSRALTITTFATCGCVLALPLTPLAPLLGFHVLPPLLLATILGIVFVYMVSVELTKHWFFRKHAN